MTPPTPHPNTSVQPRVVTCRTTADFLAALPHLLGFVPHESLVAVCFEGRRSGQAVRLDLPPDESPARIATTVQVLRAALDSLTGVPAWSAQGTPGQTGEGCSPEPGAAGSPRVTAASAGTPVTAVALAVVTSRGFGETSVPPWSALAQQIEHELTRDGIEIRDLCCRAANGWASYAASAAGDVPAGGNPLHEVAASPVALGAALRDETVPEHSELGAIPPGDPERCRAVAAALAEQPGADESERPSIQRVGEAARLLRSPDIPGAAATAALVTTLARADQWLGVATGILLSPERAVVLMSEPGTGRRLRNLTVPADPARAIPLPSLLFFLADISPEFTEHGRLRGVRDRLRTAIAETPAARRAPLYTLSAWVWWLAGSQSVAQWHIDAARETAPGDPLATTIAELITVPSHVSRTPAVLQHEG